jgi:hypothetical protein
MTERRDFFKHFFSQMAVIFKEMHGVKKIPLNRLCELPADTIEQIEPVFFPDKNWQIIDNTLIVHEQKTSESTSIFLSEIEMIAFESFDKNIGLVQIAKNIKEMSELSFEDIYKTITALFFKLASLRVCHPKYICNFDNFSENKNP